MPTSVALTPHFESLAHQLVTSGRYNNISEVIRDGLRLLESKVQEESAKLHALRTAVTVGLDDFERGKFAELNTPQQIEDFVRQSSERVAARVKKSGVKKLA